MKKSCPECIKSQLAPKVVRFGQFYRTSDSKWVQRFICKGCKKTFSTATYDPCYRQKKRRKNFPLKILLCSGVSQRRAAIILNISRTTLVRKFLFLAKLAERSLEALLKLLKKVGWVQFDDLETHEHSKCKPLSVTLAVGGISRLILWLQVSQMPAKGLLAKVSRRKYGPRRDEREAGREKVFSKLKELVREDVLIESDDNPHYGKTVRKFLPKGKHRTYPGLRGCITGQGELKRAAFDPLFSLNHTFAKLRADVNRLIRKTWCTTKRADRLQAHLMIYANYHNECILAQNPKEDIAPLHRVQVLDPANTQFKLEA